MPLQQVFSKISPSPIAAASLGQVYRGTLRTTGEEVAIKVSSTDTNTSIHVYSVDLYSILEREEERRCWFT